MSLDGLLKVCGFFNEMGWQVAKIGADAVWCKIEVQNCQKLEVCLDLSEITWFKERVLSQRQGLS